MEFWTGLLIGMHLGHFVKDYIEDLFISLGWIEESEREIIDRITALEEGICGELKK